MLVLTIGRYYGGIVDVYLWWRCSGSELVEFLSVSWNEIWFLMAMTIGLGISSKEGTIRRRVDEL